VNLFLPRGSNLSRGLFDYRESESQSTDAMASDNTHGVSVISSRPAMMGSGEGMMDGEGKNQRRVLACGARG
jgi:hypothetical protein